MTSKKQRSRRPAVEPEDSNRGPRSSPDNPSTAPNQSGDQQGGAPRGKLGVIADLLKRPEGATIQQLMDATGWQSHSIRGAMAGALTRKYGLLLSSEKTDAGRVYRARPGVDR